MRDGSLNQGQLRLPMMGWRIKSSESLWALVLLYYPGSGTGWWWDQIPHCRWGRCTGSCHRSSHTGPHRTAPGSSRTRSHLRKTGEEGVRSARYQARTHRHALRKRSGQGHMKKAYIIWLLAEWFISNSHEQILIMVIIDKHFFEVRVLRGNLIEDFPSVRKSCRKQMEAAHWTWSYESSLLSPTSALKRMQSKLNFSSTHDVGTWEYGRKNVMVCLTH